MTYEQPELPLEEATYDHYTVELRKGPAHAEQTVRSHTAGTVEEAETLIEGLRDSYNQRADVTWKAEEADSQGRLYGLDPSGEVFLISVVPPLSVELS